LKCHWPPNRRSLNSLLVCPTQLLYRLWAFLKDFSSYGLVEYFCGFPVEPPQLQAPPGNCFLAPCCL
jgi:hypothetical protein